MTAWIVRGGRHGEHEKRALDEGILVLFAGGEVPLDRQTREQLSGRLRSANPDKSAYWVGHAAAVQDRFGNPIANGDLIVMPQKGKDIVAVGVAGRYQHDSWGNHARSVSWIETSVPKDLLNNGWRRSLTSEWTVLRLKDHEDERRFKGETIKVPPTSGPRATGPEPNDPWSKARVEGLATELLWQPEQLQEIIDDLQEKRQVIFFGPPGTGKTYVAREIALQSWHNGGDFEVVQFHPSYSYEDFVQGYRPQLFNGRPGFALVDGPLLRIAERAEDNPDATFILLIDELNRGNVAKVFGELYFLLEYRDEEMRLQYGGGEDEGFSLPPNLWFICTMNTADRSIALMDAALRRRFYFAPFFLDEPPIKGLLRRWIAEYKPEAGWVADLVDLANSKLEREMGIGPSYFMDPDRPLDEDRVRRIWKRAVIPYVEEQYFGDTEKLRGSNCPCWQKPIST